MTVNHTIPMDLVRKGISPQIHVAQNDSLSRMLELELLADGKPWTIPEEAKCIIFFSKPDGTGGEFDTLPNGETAWKTRGNRLTLVLPPQALTAPGTVELTATLLLGGARLTSFLVLLEVQRQPNFSGVSESYSNVGAYLPQPAGAVRAGQFLQVRDVDANGHVLALQVASGPLSPQVTQALLALLRSGLYTRDVSNDFADLERQLGQHDSDVVPASISAAYGGSGVVEGTPVSTLAELLSVTRHYTDGSSKPLSSGEFVLSGETITVGDNPITVTDLQTGLQTVLVLAGLPLIRQVTAVVEDISESTCVSRPSTHIREGESYQVVCTIPDSKELVSIRVTMGGADITAMAVTGAAVSISAVTGDVVITMTVKDAPVTIYTVTHNLTNVNYSGPASIQENTAFQASLSPVDSFTMIDVQVLMGQADITSDVYANGQISIAKVTGDIVITAAASNGSGEVTMTGLSAHYSGGAVSTEMEVQDIMGIAVTAHFSDGTTQAVEKYVISGQLREGENILVVSYNGFSTTVKVPAIYAPLLCSITKQLTHATSNNTLPSVPGGSYYTAKIVAEAGFMLENVSVIMGGRDVTAAVYAPATGIITIDAVSGDIVITAVAVDGEGGYKVTNILTNVSTDNAASAITPGAPYECTLTPMTGYALKYIIITMGGVEQINSAYDRSPLYQGWKTAMVTGDIVITAIAEEV